MDACPFSIAMVNRKGGCAKTENCHPLSGCFAHLSYRVLLVDMDPAANLTQGFFGPVATEAMPAGRTVLSLFDDAYDPVRQTSWYRPGPSGSRSSQALMPLMISMRPPKKAGPLQSALSGFLREVQGQFDVIIVDCPPNLQLWSWNALVAADFVIVPVQAEDFGAQGITHIQRAIDEDLKTMNPRLRMLGYLVTLRQHLALQDAYEARQGRFPAMSRLQEGYYGPKLNPLP
jgi:chromosome partitioning protein